jgi:hypothetical protein
MAKSISKIIKNQDLSPTCSEGISANFFMEKGTGSWDGNTINGKATSGFRITHEAAAQISAINKRKDLSNEEKGKIMAEITLPFYEDESCHLLSEAEVRRFLFD